MLDVRVSLVDLRGRLPRILDVLRGEAVWFRPVARADCRKKDDKYLELALAAVRGQSSARCRTCSCCSCAAVLIRAGGSTSPKMRGDVPYHVGVTLPIPAVSTNPGHLDPPAPRRVL